MGFLGDLRKLERVSSNSYGRLDVKSRLADAQAQLDALNAPFASADPRADARRVAATATVLRSAPTGTMVNFDMVVALELLVAVGGVHIPVHAQIAISPVQLGRMAAGSTLSVSIDPARPEGLRILWS